MNNAASARRQLTGTGAQRNQTRAKQHYVATTNATTNATTTTTLPTQTTNANACQPHIHAFVCTTRVTACDDGRAACNAFVDSAGAANNDDDDGDDDGAASRRSSGERATSRLGSHR